MAWQQLQLADFFFFVVPGFLMQRFREEMNLLVLQLLHLRMNLIGNQAGLILNVLQDSRERSVFSAIVFTSQFDADRFADVAVDRFSDFG